METYKSDQYITLPISELQEVQNNGEIISAEDIIKPASECIVPEMMIECSSNIEISENQMDANLSLEEEESEAESSNSLVKQEKDQSMTSGDDESMAVEALRQLGNIYPCYEDKTISCPNCASQISESEMEAHKLTCRSQKFICSVCSEQFDKKVDFSNHMVCHQVERPHACRACGNLFKTKASLQVHVNEMHQGQKLHRCTICGLDFQRPSSLSNHLKIHSYVAGRAIAQVQPAEKASTSMVVQEYEPVQWSVPVYSLEEDDKLHEFAVVSNGDVAQLDYPQQFVIGSLNSSDSGIRIEAVQYGNAEEEEKRTPAPIECEFCDKQFRDQMHLSSHQKTCVKRAQAGAEPGASWGKHACMECGKKFTTKQKMFRHQWIHRKKTHACEICGTQFERQLELDEHRLAAHPGDSPFTCTECGKSFVSRQGLWEHGRTHAGSPAHFHCDKCSKTFTSRQGYLIHHRTHTGERPYGCKFCWKAFRDGGTLRKHERIHTGERPHVCPLCSRAFNQKVVLREHVRWVHAAAKNGGDESSPPFSCPLCGDLSQDRDELCAHIVKHSDKMIAEAKAKNEPKKAPKGGKKKSKSESKKPVELEQEQIVLTPYIDPQQNTYILVNTVKNSKIQLLPEQKENSSKLKTEEIQICIEDVRSEQDGVGEEDQKRNTLRLISKRNADTPVVTIPNPQTNENFSSQIQFVDEEDEGEFGEHEAMEILQVESIQFEQDDDAEECRVCGEIGFENKRQLMEHVKTHM